MGKFSKIAKRVVGVGLGALAVGLLPFTGGASLGLLALTGGAVAGARAIGGPFTKKGLPDQAVSGGLPPFTGGAEVRRGGRTISRQYQDPATGNVITEYLPTPEEEANRVLNDKLLNLALGKISEPDFGVGAEVEALSKAFEQEQKAQLAEPFRAQEQAVTSEITRLGARGSPFEAQLRGEVAKKEAEVLASLGRQKTFLREDIRSRRQAELQGLIQLARSGTATQTDIERLNNLQAQSAREFELGLGLQRENLALGREALLEETRARKKQSTAELGLLGLIAGRDIFGFGKKAV